MEDVNLRRRIFLFLFEPGQNLKYSNTRKNAYFWQIENIQIDAIKFEWTQIHFFDGVFTAGRCICRVRRLDRVLQGQYLRILSVNYVAINKDLEKLPTDLY